MITIRKFEKVDKDYEDFVHISNTVWPDYADTVDEWKDADKRRSEKIRWNRFFADLDGKPVGIASYSQSLWMYHPQKFFANVNVLPEARRQGVGTRLYEHLLDELAQYDPIRLLSSTREDMSDGMAFAAHLGFEEVMREWESRLDPSTVDLDAYRELEEKIAARGIEIKTVRQLESDPDRDRKLYELDTEVDQDVPSPEPPTPAPFDEWMKVWKNPNLLPDGWFVAVDGDKYVGVSNLWSSQALPNILYTGLTGVVRSHRRMGLATALKLHAIRYARAQGKNEVRTWNESNNVGMLSINIELGFVRQPAHVEFSKWLKEEEQSGEDEAVAQTATT